MTMYVKPTTSQAATKFAPTFLVATIAATLFAFSGSAFAVTSAKDQAKPVDSLQQLINDANNQKHQDALQKAKIADEKAELSSDDAEDIAIQNEVNHEIAEQTNNDVVEGEVVTAPTSIIDEDSIKSIENKDGKIYKTTNLSNYARAVNGAVWTPNMRKNTAMSVKMQALLDWNHASPGPVDGGWGMNSTKALANFQTMKGLPSTGKMDTATWNALIKNINPNQPVLVQYTLTQDDVNTNFAPTPSGSEAKSKMKGLYYQNIKEMLGERFHMDVRYLEKLNKGKTFSEGEVLTVLNVGDPLKNSINHVVADKAARTLYAYNGDKLVATYPTTVGSTTTPSPTGSYKIVNKVKMPWYKSTVSNGDKKQIFMLPPGPNNPVGVVWMGLSKPSYGIHGSPIPEGISRQASAGCVRLTNWDVLEVFANIEGGATVDLK
ncbi:L,D-transpeptidase family protein [Psychrobacter sp.]|uniref:L,D-transpeptidase family protein n=1 Tax=Psychrobacter sp. TaxID=56811 RepID=UPI0025DE05AC|nr:L,D-transpeptidase family protein [Psychrobacter sp.]